MTITGRGRVGRLVGAAFGLVFVQADVGTLPVRIGTPPAGAGAAAFVALVIPGRRTATDGAAPGDGDDGGVTASGRRYWYVVVAEALGLVARLVAWLVVITRVFHAPQASVGWIALVVGVHFFGLAAAWLRPSLHLLGAGIAGCGAAGLALAAGGASASLIRVTAGVLPGALLLGSAWCAGRPRTGVTPTVC
ncbi:hypothetical protein [Streptomyces sp. NPDC058084]|uniref:hypothetical protein n=1 Tax=Streptomyces sp. NPDC058084 TaxID=3346333 RepID=UPI0036ED32EF